MIKLIKILTSLVVSVMFVGALVPAATAVAAPAIPPQPQQIFSKDGQVVGGQASAINKAATMSEWTLANRQAARPLEVTLNPADVQAALLTSGGGASGSVAGKMADPSAIEQAKTQFPDAWAAMANRQSASLPNLQVPSLITPQGTKGVYDGYLGNYWTPFYQGYPFYDIGRLYFDDGVSLFWCTAALISPNSVVVTAAHCLYNTDANFWYENWFFQPDDYAGSAPLGSYPYYQYYVMTAWLSAKSSSKGAALDVGVVSFSGNPSFYGWLGYAWGQSTKSLLTTIGYSANVLGGAPTYVCVSESFPKGGDLIGQGCPMDNTAGGAPAILGFFPFEAIGNYVEGVVHGGATGTNIYDARFSTKNFTPLCAAIGC